MTPESAATVPRSRWRRWRIGRWFLVVLLAVFGYGAWQEYDFRAAIKEAKALGWDWRYDDPFEAIRKDWRAAFRKATWTDARRLLTIQRAAEFVRHSDLVRRLAPKGVMIILGGPELKDLSALNGLASLEALVLNDCTGLANVDAVKGFPALKRLHFSGCTGLTNVDALKGLAALQWLHLAGCTGLTNVDALKGLAALRELRLHRCTGLKNVDALKGLAALHSLYLDGCTNLPAEAIAALRAALPNTKIIDRYGPSK